MSDITYCSQTTCVHRDCSRHQVNVTTCNARIIRIADLNDGLCFDSEEVHRSSREKLLVAICRGTQKTNYKCNDVCKAMCGNDGSCAYCSIIADAIEEEFK